MVEPGGPAANAGVHYQNTIAALYLGRMLDPRPRPEHDRIVEIHLETLEPVDDILVVCGNGSKIFIQVRINISFNSPEFKDLFCSFWEQIQRKIFTPHDRISLIIGVPSNSAINLRECARRASTSNDRNDLLARLNESQKRILKKIDEILKKFHPDASIYVLKSLNVEVIDRTTIERDLSPIWMPPANLSPDQILSILTSVSLIGSQNRFRFSLETLIDELNKHTTIEIEYSNRLISTYSSRVFPGPPVHFVGRDNDVAQISSTILSQAIAGKGASILITGPQGIGKSALSCAVGSQRKMIRQYGGRRWFVELERTSTNARFQDEIARTVGIDPRLGFDATLTFLGKAPGLLVLDNLETCWAPLRERALTETSLAKLSRVPALSTIVSMSGCRTVGSVAWSMIHEVDDLSPQASRNLFQKTAQTLFERDPDLTPLLKKVGGNPLSIMLVALRSYRLASLRERWSEWLGIDEENEARGNQPSGASNSLPLSIALAINSSDLTSAAKRLFALLGISPAGLKSVDRDKLIGSREEASQAQETLLRFGLAVQHVDRIDLLPAIREYASRNVAPSPEDRGRWRSHFLRLLEALGEAIGSPKGAAAMKRLVPEFSNLEASLRDCISQGHRVEAMAAVEGFRLLTYIGSLPTQVFKELARACRKADDVRGEALCLRAKGDVLLARTKHAAAHKSHEQAIILSRIARDHKGEADSFVRFGEIHFARSEFDQALLCYERAKSLYQKAKIQRGVANCIKFFGDIAFARGDHVHARAHFKLAQRRYLKLEHNLGAANCAARLAELSLERRRYDESRKHYQSAMALFKNAGDPRGQANCITGEGYIFLGRSDPEKAERQFNRSLTMHQAAGDLMGVALCLEGLGATHLERRNFSEAKTCLEKAKDIFRGLNALSGEASCHVRLARAARAQSKANSAVAKMYELAQKLYRTADDLIGQADCYVGLAEIAHENRRRAAARKAFGKAIKLYDFAGAKIASAEIRVRLAHL